MDNLAFDTVLDEVAKARTFRPELEKYVIVASCSRDVDLQEQVREYTTKTSCPFQVEVLFWPDILRELAGDRALVRKYWPDFFVDVEAATPLVTPARWRREPSIQSLMESSEWGAQDDSTLERWEAELEGTDREVPLSQVPLESFVQPGSALEFIQDQRRRWAEATDPNQDPAQDAALEMCFARCTEDAELDVGFRNLASVDVVISQIEVRVMVDLGYVAPMLEPCARYRLPVGELKVGETARREVAHVVPSRSAERILIDVDDLRTLLLRVVLHTRRGLGVAADVWLFPQELEYDDD
ncbi:MAG: hypothetical protein H6716_20755 [Polyangiaceae bacterium]|nr:hypothetical protein [Polyangiaceae bacterium]